MGLLEIACFNPKSAMIAAAAGADRVELCSDAAAGGVTPPSAWLSEVKAQVTTPVFAMIRPRAGNFRYSDAEFEEMRRTIAAFRPQADGFVLGLLDGDGRVDVARTSELVRLASPLPCTFHRAFDETTDLMQALEDVVATGCHSILSSGGASNAAAGADVLTQLVEKAAGRIVMIAGGSIRLSNVQRVRVTSGVSVCHSSALAANSLTPDDREIRQMKAMLSQSGDER
ncbi:Copper homeostasis protein CutC [Cercospora zeina]